jgi:hypothetical protein
MLRSISWLKHRSVRWLKLAHRKSFRAEQISIARGEFDAAFYLTQYPDVKDSGMDPVEHYMSFGWTEGRNPRPDFNTYDYLHLNFDVAIAGLNPFYHYLAYGKAEGRKLEAAPFLHASETANYIVQNNTFPLEAERAEKLMVIVVPEHNEMSGGIFSFFTIARAAYEIRRKHDYHVLIMTRPNRHNLTYLRQRNFRNSEDVYRFEQITRCQNARVVYLHIPEYATTDFVQLLSNDVLTYLRSRERLYINILNQKIDIMPDKKEFADLRTLANELTQSVAHHAYFGQGFSDRYDMPMLLLPPYTDLSGYEPIPFEDKEKLIIYSPDDAKYRGPVLRALEAGLPDYSLREIRGITFDEYMDLASRCRFSITFGEGFDGYLAQPIHQGGVSFAVYNEEFFPSKDLISFDNIFSSGEEMISGIVDRIRALEKDSRFYRRTNQSMIDLYDSLYSKVDYLRRVEMLINRKFEFYPLHLAAQAGAIRI